METMIGKKVIVRASVAGVHAGELVAFNAKDCTALLKGAYRLWRVYTRDSSGSISDIAANGLKPDGRHSIGARIESVLIYNPQGFEIAEMTEDAYRSVCDWKN